MTNNFQYYLIKKEMIENINSQSLKIKKSYMIPLVSLKFQQDHYIDHSKKIHERCIFTRYYLSEITKKQYGTFDRDNEYYCIGSMNNKDFKISHDILKLAKKSMKLKLSLFIEDTLTTLKMSDIKII